MRNKNYNEYEKISLLDNKNAFNCENPIFSPPSLVNKKYMLVSLLERGAGHMREKPLIVAEFVRKRNLKRKNVVDERSISGQALKYLYEHKDEALSSTEISDKIGKKIHTGSLNLLWRKGYINRSKKKLPVGKGESFIYSYSEKSINKRIFEIMPESVKKTIALANKTNAIYSVSELEEICGLRPNSTEQRFWLDWMCVKEYNLLKKKVVRGIRTFYYGIHITEERYQYLYEKYYQENVLKQESLSKLNGIAFEQFASWVFAEYLKLKGYNISLRRVDREPCDYIIDVKLNIGDLMVKDKNKEITLSRFVVSCKNNSLKYGISSKYVLGMSGALKEGLAFNGERIFTPRNSIGVIICTKAYQKALPVRPRANVIDQKKIFELFGLYQEPKIKALFAFLYLTSVRISEALKITRPDIKTEKMKGKDIYVVHSPNLKNRYDTSKIIPIIPYTEYEKKMFEYFLDYLKTIPNYSGSLIFPDLKRDLAHHKLAKQKIKVKAAVWNKYCKLCRNPLWRTHGEMICTNANCENYKKILTEKDIKTVREEKLIDFTINPHYLRHCRLTHLSELGFDISDLIAIAGWATPNTATIYVRKNWRRAAKKILNYIP